MQGINLDLPAYMNLWLCSALYFIVLCGIAYLLLNFVFIIHFIIIQFPLIFVIFLSFDYEECGFEETDIEKVELVQLVSVTMELLILRS